MPDLTAYYYASIIMDFIRMGTRFLEFVGVEFHCSESLGHAQGVVLGDRVLIASMTTT